MKKIKILGMDYSVSAIPNPIFDNGYVQGHVDSTLEVITIDNELSENLTHRVIIHECIHAIDWNLGTSLSENQVEALSTGIHLWMCDNKELIKQIIGVDK